VLQQRNALPQLSGEIFLADGGLETTLVFLEGIDLPAFAAFPLITHDQGRDALRRYFRPYLDMAAARRTGFVLDTPTWRANTDWGEKLGYSREALARINRDSVAFALELKSACAGAAAPIVVNGVLGPRGDGYKVETRMTAAEAERYHHPQVEAFRAGGADMVSAITMTYPEEAIGIARAAAANGMPAVISFTVETDGKLPSGDTFQAAIEAVDRRSTGLLQGQLRASAPLRRSAGGRRALARSDPRPSRQCLYDEPRGTRCRHRARHRRSGRPRPPLSRSAPASERAMRPWGLLRHRSPACGGDLRGMHAGLMIAMGRPLPDGALDHCAGIHRRQ
jgi:S-methylmethionine-dependent homocysteine/selenocysteine methylase